jgi:hypothetical protein
MALSRIIVVAIAASCAMFIAVPAIAKKCSSQVYNGRGTGGSVQEATIGAIAAWKKRVEADYGSAWSNWDIAVGKGSYCTDSDPQGIKYKECDVYAKPCTFMKFQKYKPNIPFIKKTP